MGKPKHWKQESFYFSCTNNGMPKKSNPRVSRQLWFLFWYWLALLGCTYLFSINFLGIFSFCCNQINFAIYKLQHLIFLSMIPDVYLEIIGLSYGKIPFLKKSLPSFMTSEKKKVWDKHIGKVNGDKVDSPCNWINVVCSSNVILFVVLLKVKQFTFSIVSLEYTN